MSESDNEEDSRRDTGPYPRSELRRARRSFLIAWTTARHRDPIIRRISEAHRVFPPRIRMKNCVEYPFQDEYIQDLILKGQNGSSRPENTRGPVTNGPRKRYGSISLYCDFLQKKVEAEEPSFMAQKTRQPVQNNTFYVCDNCSHKSVPEKQAMLHLKSAWHKSCSEYSYSQCVDENDSHGTVITRPRVISNNVKIDLGWREKDITVICPVCDVILPDKILCGYHHQIHHPGHQAQCTFGLVLEVRDFKLYRDYFCSQCNQYFKSQTTFVDHWYKPNSLCPSPFLLNEPSGQRPPDHVIEMQCRTCGIHIDRATPAFIGGRYLLPKKRKRRRSQTSMAAPIPKDPLSRFVGWVDTWSRLCVNHAYLHLDSKRDAVSSCSLRVRFVKLQKTNVFTIPPFVNHSDDLLLQFCLNECKQLVVYLERFRTGRKALYRQSKATLNELREMTKMHSSFSKVNSTAPRRDSKKEAEPSTSTQHYSAPMFIM